MERVIRLPLQVGTSSVWSYARFALTLVPGLTLAAGALAVLVDEGASGDGDGALVLLAVAGLGLGLAAYALMHLYLAVRLRPCDVLVEPRGLRVEGGPHRGAPIAWATFEPGRTRIVETSVRRITIGFLTLVTLTVILSVLTRRTVNLVRDPMVRVWRLSVALRGRGEVVLAEAESEVERASLEALRDCIDAMSAPRPSVPPPRAAHVLACGGCGAPVPPVDAEVVPCGYCRAPISLSPDLRERARAAARITDARRRTDALVGKLLVQPGAHATNLAYAAAALPMAVAWPLAAGVGAAAASLDALSTAGIASLVLLPLAVILGAVVALRLRLVNRQALRLLTLGFAARRPDAPGAPPTCRRCGGPLAHGPADVVARCAYCDAENILGIDLGGRVEAHTEEAASLEGALRARGRERTVWLALSPIVLVLLVGGALAFGAGALRAWAAHTGALPPEGGREHGGAPLASPPVDPKAPYPAPTPRNMK